MNLTFKSFLTTVRRYSTSVVLNIVGLAIAFTTATLIIMQVKYEYDCDNTIPYPSRTYRVGLDYGTNRSAMYNQPLLDHLISQTAHVKYSSMMNIGDAPLLETVRDNGQPFSLTVTAVEVYPQMADLLGLEIIAGDPNTLSSPDKYLIPEAVAKVISPEGKDVIGRKLGGRTIGAVYRDRQTNTVFRANAMFSISAQSSQCVYYTRPVTEKNGPYNWNYMFFVVLDADGPETFRAFEDSMNKALKDYFVDWETPPTAAVTLVGSDLNFCKDKFDYDIGGKTNKTSIDALFFIAILIVLIAVINFINFSSALSPMRMKNINMQKVVGARDGSLRWTLIFESIAISFIAYALNIVMLMALNHSNLPQLLTVDMSMAANVSLLFWGLGISILVGVIAGVYPAYYMTSFPPIMSLKGSFGMSPAGRRYRSVLVSIQFIISIVLIITALFVNFQNRFVRNTSTGYDREEVLCTNLPGDSYFKFNEAVTSAVRGRSEFVDVAYSMVPFGYTSLYMNWGRNFGNRTLYFNVLPASRNYLDVLGIDVVEGRNFVESDEQNFYAAAIFNQSAKIDSLALDETWGDVVNVNNESGKVVGFVGGDVRSQSLRTPETPFAFVLFGTQKWGMSLGYVYVRMKPNVNVDRAISSLRDAIKSVDSSWDEDITLLDSWVNMQYQNDRKQSTLITMFSVIAIIISLMGVFGLVLFETQYRRKEIGVRRVFGATVGNVLMIFNRKFLIIIAICFVLSVPFGYMASSAWLGNYATHIDMHWWVFLLALIIVSLITFVTVTVRTLKAATENPSESIKSE